jgi:hypothetical protein
MIASALPAVNQGPTPGVALHCGGGVPRLQGFENGMGRAAGRHLLDQPL